MDLCPEPPSSRYLLCASAHEADRMLRNGLAGRRVGQASAENVRPRWIAGTKLQGGKHIVEEVAVGLPGRIPDDKPVEGCDVLDGAVGPTEPRLRIHHERFRRVDNAGPERRRGPGQRGGQPQIGAWNDDADDPDTARIRGGQTSGVLGPHMNAIDAPGHHDSGRKSGAGATSGDDVREGAVHRQGFDPQLIPLSSAHRIPCHRRAGIAGDVEQEELARRLGPFAVPDTTTDAVGSSALAGPSVSVAVVTPPEVSVTVNVYVPAGGFPTPASDRLRKYWGSKSRSLPCFGMSNRVTLSGRVTVTLWTS